MRDINLKSVSQHKCSETRSYYVHLAVYTQRLSCLSAGIKGMPHHTQQGFFIYH
ncbi:hypothetical protein ACRRTK_001915 [Alexandromys fortis]